MEIYDSMQQKLSITLDYYGFKMIFFASFIVKHFQSTGFFFSPEDHSQSRAKLPREYLLSH